MHTSLGLPVWLLGPRLPGGGFQGESQIALIAQHLWVCVCVQCRPLSPPQTITHVTHTTGPSNSCERTWRWKARIPYPIPRARWACSLNDYINSNNSCRQCRQVPQSFLVTPGSSHSEAIPQLVLWKIPRYNVCLHPIQLQRMCL